MIIKPTAKNVKKYRLRAKLTRSQAGQLNHRTARCWQDAELDRRNMDLAAWELFLIKTGISLLIFK